MNKDLNTALDDLRVILTQRAQAYGNIKDCAVRYSMMRDGIKNKDQLAIDMIKVKIARIETSTPAYDSWLDIAGYALLMASQHQDQK
ncbi:MAG: DUF6378 domain-containing protein [Alphaproteobacteria bacterium]